MEESLGGPRSQAEPVLEDIRGWEIEWKLRSIAPMYVDLFCGEDAVGAIYRKTNLQPRIDAELAGLQWELSPESHFWHSKFVVRFIGSDGGHGLCVAESACSQYGIIKAEVDGTDAYTLSLAQLLPELSLDGSSRLVSGLRTTSWFGADSSVLISLASQSATSYKSEPCERGIIRVSQQIEPTHAPVLVLLAMAHLFFSRSNS